jgi:biofilm protein TabA
MILDTIENAGRYFSMHPGFRTAFEFMRDQDLKSKEPGTYRIDGESLFVMISVSRGSKKTHVCLEAHKKYIDIQVVLSGVDRIGYKPTHACSSLQAGYDAEKDCEFYRDEPDAWCTVPEGSFVVFYPEDAHAPLAGSEQVAKAVFKVRV